ALSYFKENKFQTATSYLSEYNFLNDNDIRALLKYNSKIIAKRNRSLATLLSAIIPGSGQIYAGRFGDGIYSFLTVIGSGLITKYYLKNDDSKIKFGIFSFLTLFFWSGNIYGANIAARDYNNFQLLKYQNEIDNIINKINLVPNYNQKYEKLSGGKE
ncbi:MAG: hypothetical protein ABIK31_06170, partial [candidate division WOR-3 bacterium]